jgi:hypothetical protein
MHIFSGVRKSPKTVVTLSLVLVIALALAFAISSHTVSFAKGAQKHHSPTVYHYGPIHTTNDPDSGTCGNNWATDSFNRFFTISAKNVNTVVENFNNGHFVTVAGQSPGACQIMPAPTGNGNMVGDGVTGTFHGHEVIVVTGGTFNPRAKCRQSNCNTTAGFIATVYGSSATFNVTSFDFDYSTPENGGWHNASADQGGNRGDITGLPGEPHAAVVLKH